MDDPFLSSLSFIIFNVLNVKYFHYCSTVKTYDKTIFLMTCTDNPHAADNKLQHAARERAGNLSQQGIKLEILSFGMTFNVDVFFKVLKLFLAGHLHLSLIVFVVLSLFLLINFSVLSRKY